MHTLLKVLSTASPLNQLNHQVQKNEPLIILLYIKKDSTHE